MAKRGPRSVAGASGSIASAGRQIRCAIYTRKSTEEGLEQEFNSLDAQHEACAAYIASQRHEGWTLVPARYDDGGFSGGTMERPGLKRLLADVEAGCVDVIAVYKVDRLTRALSDFVKIVEVLDARGASFVSITQAFNTTTSMGRLTLNVLLSFAQFEREVTGERIRDKIAASKKKGMWMGGPVPLGYDVHERKLIVNETEAATVRLIFERHRALGSISELAADLAANSIVSKLRRMRDGRVAGGVAYSAGALGYLLRNVLYSGRVPHGDQTYEGEHSAIIERDLWDASQALLDRSMPRPHTGHVSLLAGMLTDAHGRAMAPAHANKGDRRYRYYVSRPRDGDAEQPWRIPAGDLEVIVKQAVSGLLNDPVRMAAERGLGHSTGCTLPVRGLEMADNASRPASARALLEQLGIRVTIAQDQIEVALDRRALAALVGDASTHQALEPIRLSIPAKLKRRGHELRLVYSAADLCPAQRDDRMIQLIASGRTAYRELASGAASNDATRRSHLTRLARLQFLAPDIVTAILAGRQPVELTSRTLLRIPELPLDWSEQRRVLGFG